MQGSTLHPAKFHVLLAAAVTALVVVSAPQWAEAATYYYDTDSDTPGFGTAGGIWATPTPGPIPGWTTDATGASVPGSVTTTISDPINFGNGATGLGAGTISLSGALSCGNITFASGSGAILLTGGTSLTLPATATITVNNSSDTIATPLAGAGTGLTKAGVGTLTLSGDNTVTGTLTVNSGELALNGGSFNLGAKALSVPANTSTSQMAVFNILNGSFTNSVTDSIGRGTNAVGVVKLNGGNLVKTAGNINFGAGTGGKVNYGALLMSEGYASIAGEFNMAWDGVGASAYVGLSGGTLVCNSYATVGREGFGVLDISGGTLFRPSTAANRFYMNRSAGSFSQLTLRGAGTLHIEDNVGYRFANSTANAGSGVANLLTGGTLISRVGISWSGAGITFGHFNFNGGTLKASGSSATFWTDPWSACYIYSGGATIDSQDNNITIAQPFLVPSGNGVTSITGGIGSGYLSPPVVKIEGGGGMGATAVAEIDASGNILNILVTNPGVDYTSAPTVTLVGGGGTASGWTAAVGSNATSGGLTKLGSGTVTLTSASTYQGSTKVGAGTLAIAAANYPSASSLTVSNGAALEVDVSGGYSTLATPALILDPNSSLTFDYGTLGGNPFQPAISDVTINAGTALSAAGTNIVINLSGSGFTAGQFPVIKYAGSIGGSGFAAFKLGSKPGGFSAAQLVNNPGNGSIDVIIPAVNSLTWNGTNANWDVNTSYNWVDASMLPARYAEYGTTNIYGDIVTFNDNLSDPSMTSINLTTTLRPTSINLTAVGTAYTFSGPGKISGGSHVNVSGYAPVTFSAANDYSGGSTLAGGTVLVGHDSALGSGPITLAGSVLSADSTTPRALTNAVSISADSTFGVDATSGALTLSGPIDFGGTAWGLSMENSVTLSGPASDGGITKSGNGTLTVDNADTVLSDTIWVNAGKVTLNNGTFTGAFQIAPVINQVGVVEIVNANVTNTAVNNIASAPDSVGVIKQSGGSFVETGIVNLGNGNSSSAAYLMSGGFAYFGGDIRLDNLGAVGLISQTGGDMVSTHYFSIARDGGLGVYDLSGGTHTRPTTAANRFYMGSRADNGYAIVNVRSTGALDIQDNNGLCFGNNNTTLSYGAVNLLGGGALISRVGLQWLNSNPSSIGYVNFNGGTLRASGSSANYWSGWTAGYIYGGGATIDSQDNRITIGQGLLAPTGSGVTSITGFSGSGFLSPPVVSISGDGTGATAVAQIDSGGDLTGILVTSPGVNYTFASISLNGGGGTGFGGTASLGINLTTGGLTKLGTGTLTLTGGNTYAGPTTVGNGTLVLGKAHAAPGGVNVADGAALGCWSDVPGASVRIASATLGGVTGAKLLAEFTGNTGNPTSPAGFITNLTLNGSTPVTVSCSGIQAGTIPLIRYSSLGGAGSVTTGTLPQGVVGIVTNNTASKTIELVVTSVVPLVWSGASSGIWDINTSSNWVVGVLPTTYLEGDRVHFDDTAVNPSVVITQAVSPGSILFSNNSAVYNVGTSGDGALSGTAGLTKDGTSTLILSGVNTYLGVTLIRAGTLQLGDGGTAGSLATGGSIQVDADATLVHNRSDTAGFGSQNISGGGTLNKIGSGDGPGLTGTNTFSGQINIQTATLGLVGSESENGQPSVYVAPGARLAIGNGFNGGFATIGNLTGGGNVNASYTTGAGTRGLQVNQTTDGAFTGAIANGTSSRLVALTKTGPAVLTLAGTCTYTGPTAVSNGTLLVNGAITGSAVAVEAGATLGGSGVVAVSVSFAEGSIATNNVGSPLTVGTLDMAGNATMNVATAAPLSAGDYPLINFTSLTGTGQFTSFNVGGSGLAGGASANVVMGAGSVYLSVVGGTPIATNISHTFNGSELVLDWPAGQGWLLQSNSVNVANPAFWHNVSGATPPFTSTIDPATPAVFFRLKN